MVHARFCSKVSLVLEGLPPHAWEREVAEDLLGSACIVDSVEPETSSRSDLSAFKLSAWTVDPESIPSLRWLAIPEPGLLAPLMEPSLLQYKILIHIDSVAEFGDRDEPFFLGSSSDSGQSGLPEPDRDFGGGGGGGGVPIRRAWQFGVRDARCLGPGSAYGGGHGRSPGTSSVRTTPGIVGAEWRIPPMREK